MIPATRHVPILAVLGWHPYHGITIHIWCDWGTIATAYLHAFFYILKYSFGDYHKQAPGQHGWNYLFPPRMCFVPFHYSSGTDAMNGIPIPPENSDNCGDMLAGFLGTMASMKLLRRNKYAIFYFDISCGKKLRIRKRIEEYYKLKKVLTSVS